MIGNTLLNEIVKDKHIIQPNLILDHLNQSMVAELRQSEDASNVSDGMDIALCAFDVENGHAIPPKKGGRGVLQYAGAYRPLFLVRNGKLSEIKGDRFSIGGLQTDRKRKFTNHTLDIQKGDSIYIFTDGFVDQLCGSLNI